MRFWSEPHRPAGFQTGKKLPSLVRLPQACNGYDPPKGATVMQDIQAYLEKLQRDAIDRALISS
jgi:hypothetical protein